MTRHMHYAPTRSGIALVEAPEFKPFGDAPALQIAYYAPKPAWMTHIPGPFLRFGNRFAFNRYLSEGRA